MTSHEWTRQWKELPARGVRAIPKQSALGWEGEEKGQIWGWPPCGHPAVT